MKYYIVVAMFVATGMGTAYADESAIGNLKTLTSPMLMENAETLTPRAYVSDRQNKDSGRYESSIRDYSIAGCNIVSGFLERFAGRAGLNTRGQCVRVAGAQYTVQVDFKGSPAAGSLAYETPVCVSQDGYPFAREANNFAFEANLVITSIEVSYEIGGAAFCRPGLFNKLDISWKVLTR